MNILGLGLPELLVIAFVLLLFFGKDRLPGLFRAVGSSIKELKDGLTSSTDESSSSSAVQHHKPEKFEQRQDFETDVHAQPRNSEEQR